LLFKKEKIYDSGVELPAIQDRKYLGWEQMDLLLQWDLGKVI
jgi:hypothetical protein